MLGGKQRVTTMIPFLQRQKLRHRWATGHGQCHISGKTQGWTSKLGILCYLSQDWWWSLWGWGMGDVWRQRPPIPNYSLHTRLHLSWRRGCWGMLMDLSPTPSPSATYLPPAQTQWPSGSFVHSSGYYYLIISNRLFLSLKKVCPSPGHLFQINSYASDLGSYITFSEWSSLIVQTGAIWPWG